MAERAIREVSKSARQVVHASQGVLMASLAVNVLVAAVLCVLLAPGVLFDYSGPGLLPSAGKGLAAVNMQHIKQAVMFALVMGVIDVGVGVLFNQMLMAIMRPLKSLVR